MQDLGDHADGTWLFSPPLKSTALLHLSLCGRWSSLLWPFGTLAEWREHILPVFLSTVASSQKRQISGWAAATATSAAHGKPIAQGAARSDPPAGLPSGAHILRSSGAVVSCLSRPMRAVATWLGSRKDPLRC